MNPQEKTLFDAHAVLLAHANLLARGIANDAPLDMILAQIAIVKDAAEAYAKLPRPQQQKAA